MASIYISGVLISDEDKEILIGAVAKLPWDWNVKLSGRASSSARFTVIVERPGRSTVMQPFSLPPIMETVTRFLKTLLDETAVP